MEFKLENCNNIIEGTIQIQESKLNLKFGINGTGKSTIARAIKYSIESPEKLTELMPFKVKGNEDGIKPTVSKPKEIDSIFIFNEEYLNQFLFKEDELISNSFEIFIKTPSYIESVDKIDELLIGIKNVFSENQELDQIISDFENLSKSFATTQTSLSKSSPFYKATIDGNKREHVPEHLIGYSSFIKNDECTSWLDWQIKGEKFLEISDDCPYCTASTINKKDTIKSIATTYDKKTIENLTLIIKAIDNLGAYFTEVALTNLRAITKKNEGLDDSEIGFIIEIKKQIENILNKLKALKTISISSFKNEDAAIYLKSLEINIDLYGNLNSEKTINLITSFNTSLTNVLAKIGLLKGEINKQKSQTNKLIEKHKKEINSFLNNAGFNYSVDIQLNSNDEYKLKLQHNESNELISKGNQFLSFGEKNAFALVLFMYEALAKNPNIIVLDDPISSFDKNKKFAIMSMLFTGKNSLRNKTVLLFTHDIEPIIDSVKILKADFSEYTVATHINTTNGILYEKLIKNDNILTFSQICKKIIASDSDDLIKLIYLRRNFEVLNDLGNEYEVLSNLLHKRPIAELTDNRKPKVDNKLSSEDFDIGFSEIQKHLNSFNYETHLVNLNDISYLKKLYSTSKNSYIKLNIFRLIYKKSDNKDDGLHSVIRKFITETYHIENEFICQLDPTEFDIIPNYIIEVCDNYLNEKI